MIRMISAKGVNGKLKFRGGARRSSALVRPCIRPLPDPYLPLTRSRDTEPGLPGLTCCNSKPYNILIHTIGRLGVKMGNLGGFGNEHLDHLTKLETMIFHDSSTCICKLF